MLLKSLMLVQKAELKSSYKTLSVPSSKASDYKWRKSCFSWRFCWHRAYSLSVWQMIPIRSWAVKIFVPSRKSKFFGVIVSGKINGYLCNLLQAWRGSSRKIRANCALQNDQMVHRHYEGLQVSRHKVSVSHFACAVVTWLMLLYCTCRYGTKTSYRTIMKTVTKLVKRCCDGYEQTLEDTCTRSFFSVSHIVAKSFQKIGNLIKLLDVLFQLSVVGLVLTENVSVQICVNVKLAMAELPASNVRSFTRHCFLFNELFSAQSQRGSTSGLLGEVICSTELVRCQSVNPHFGCRSDHLIFIPLRFLSFGEEWVEG